MTNEGTFSEVDEPERLVFGETVVTFTDLGDGRTEMTFQTTMEASAELLDRAAGGVRERVRAPRRTPQGDDMSTTTTIVTGVDYVGVPTNDIDDGARVLRDRARARGLERLAAAGRGRRRRRVRDRHGHDRADQLRRRSASRSPPTRRRSRSRSTTSPPRAPSSSHEGSRSRPTHRQRRLPHGELPRPRRQRADAAPPLRAAG